MTSRVERLRSEPTEMPVSPLAPPHEERKSANTVLRRVWTTGRVNTVLGMADQGVVSLTNFLTTVLLGRIAGLDELGAYSIGFTMAVLLFSTQESLLVAPYNVRVATCTGRRARELRGILVVQQVALAGVVCVALCGLACINHFMPSELVPTSVMISLMVAIPCWSFREFARRICFAELRPAMALGMDLTTLAAQSAGLLMLWRYGSLSATSGFLTIAAANLVGGVVWWLAGRGVQLTASFARVRAVARDNWQFGKWLCASRMVAVAQAYAVHWVLILITDVRATGAYSACLAIIALANPMVMGGGALMGPYTARAFAERGPDALRAIVVRSAAYLIIATGLFVMVAWWWAERLLFWLYNINSSELQWVIGLLGLALLASVVGMGADNGLRAMSRPAANLVACLIGLVVVLAVAIPAVQLWGPLGAATGCLLGAVATSTVRCVAFRRELQLAAGGCVG